MHIHKYAAYLFYTYGFFVSLIILTLFRYRWRGYWGKGRDQGIRGQGMPYIYMY